jgi:hypothetical protein
MKEVRVPEEWPRDKKIKTLVISFVIIAIFIFATI